METQKEGAHPRPGLKWRSRSSGSVPYWIARPDAVAAGYPLKSVNLAPLASDPEILALKCQKLQQEMQEWLAGQRRAAVSFDGTIGSVLQIYETHEESTFHKLKPGSRAPYSVYLRLLRPHIGKHHVSRTTALDVKRWHAAWSSNGKHPAAGKMALAVLTAALTFCIVAGYRECRQLRDDIRELRVAGSRRREVVLTADQIVAARTAAHALGRPSAALCYAFQYETSLRLWDVAGQWYPLSAPFLSPVVHGNWKWAGLEWRHIDENLILRFTPSKTEGTSGKQVVIDLKLCPMVLEEIASVSPKDRVGPVIVREVLHRPYDGQQLRELWRAVRIKAGLPDNAWGRDLRASGLTEGRAYGATNDDASKVAGHTKPIITAEVYDRANLEAHQRFAAARIAKRPKNGSGNA